MPEPTNELMFEILREIRETVARTEARLDGIDARLDILTERIALLENRVGEGFADLRVAIRNAGKLATIVDHDNVDLKARVVALELKVAELERQN